MRRQTACNLTIRLTWEVSAGEDYDRETFDCAEDEDMAIMKARYWATLAPDRRRLVSVETSPSAGRRHPWKQLKCTSAEWVVFLAP